MHPRHARLSDIGRIAEINAPLHRWKSTSWVIDPEFVEQDIRDGIYIVLGDPAFAALSLRRRGWCAEIETLAVDPDHRKEGAGRRLVEFAVRSARQRGASVIAAYSPISLGVRGFYEACGFGLMQIHDGHYRFTRTP